MMAMEIHISEKLHMTIIEDGKVRCSVDLKWSEWNVTLKTITLKY